MLSLLREMLRSPVLEIIRHLKGSLGLTVKELCALMDMSYMGVKQHCVELEKSGFLDTWRRPRKAGRPEKLYRLTPKAEVLFGSPEPQLTLDLLSAAERVFGETAPSKLLFTHFQDKADLWEAKLQKAATLEERVKMLAKLRTADGCLSRCETGAEGGLMLVESHRPLSAVADKHAIVDELECAMIERLLESEVRRSVEEVSGLTRVTFHIKTSNTSSE
ncbi:MAG: hypothetical protein R3F13_19910 [Prosthecobacter sp.]